MKKHLFVGLFVFIGGCGTESIPFESKTGEEDSERIDVSGTYQGVLSLDFVDCGSNDGGLPRSIDINWFVDHDTDTNEITLTTSDTSYGFAIDNTFAANYLEFTEDGFRIEKIYNASYIDADSAFVSFELSVYHSVSQSNCGASHSGLVIRVPS